MAAITYKKNHRMYTVEILKLNVKSDSYKMV